LSAAENGAVRRQLRQPRLAEIVAATLRQRILAGELEDGMLPNQEKLLEEFPVSKPSLREALRILETEGLITVQRGNVGGAVVHQPKSQNAAYTLGLVLESRQVAIDDVGRALKQLESDCAGMCAQRPDRATEVVPHLEAANRDARATLDDELPYVRAMADFHEAIVGRCGNETMRLVAGALESLWLAHVSSWAEEAVNVGGFPDPQYRERGLKAHEQIAKLIAKGDVLRVTRLVFEHFDPTQFYKTPADARRTISTANLRDVPLLP
jgi:DNA-binding FadR family transcriptional regulator